MNLDDLLPKSPKKPSNLIYSYADGSANLYFITKELIEYAPMTPERSSSGVYSGGSPIKVKLDSKGFEIIKVVVELASEKIEDHIPDRVKMSGQLSFEQEGTFYNLAANSISQKAVELILNQFLGK